MIQPLLADDALRNEIRTPPRDSSELRIWWLGQSGFLVQWQGRHLLLDPYLSDSLTLKYATTDKPHVRMTQRVVAPEQLDMIDLVTSSHNHTDHLDRETLLSLRQANPGLVLVIPEANRCFVAERLGTPVGWARGLTAGATIEVAGFRLHGIPAAHNTLETDEQGRHKFMGYVIEAGPWRLYHSGDTLHFQGMEEWLRRWVIDIAFLPINGDRPERRVSGNLDGPQAATLAHAIGAKCAVPCHYELFEFNTASPESFIRTCSQLGQAFRVLKAGERMDWPPPPGGSLNQPGASGEVGTRL